MIEYKSTLHPAEIKVNKEKRTFGGYASVFGVLDSHGDIVEHGAFAKTIKSPKRSIKAMWQHEEPIGLPIAMSEDSHGLEFEAKVTNHTHFDHYLALMEEGVVDGLSIGFIPTKWSFVDKEEVEQDTSKIPEWRDVRILESVDLWEVSAVTWGSNPAAKITHVTKAHDYATRLGRGETLNDWELTELRMLVNYINVQLKSFDKLDDLDKNKAEEETKVSNDFLTETEESVKLFEEMRDALFGLAGD